MFWKQKLNALTHRVKPATIELLIIQPTPFCNIDCDYCYLTDRSNRKQLSAETLAELCRKVFSSAFLGTQMTIVWHAGEPLVLPPAFYRQAFSIIEQHIPPSLMLNHSIQTNGMLLNTEWADFIAEKNIHVGVSIDGPQKFHDSHRKTRNGKGTFQATLNGIKHLQSADIDFHVITVLTAESLAAPDELFDFYLENAIKRVCFNIEEIEGPHHHSSLQREDIESLYRTFFQKLLHRLKQLPPGSLSIREIDTTLALITTEQMLPIWNHQLEPFAILSMDVNGNLSTFSPELSGAPQPEFNHFIFGNIHNNKSLDDVLTHPAFLTCHQQIQQGITACKQNCAYFLYCGGGAPANKLFENQSLASHETLFCRLTKKTLIELVLQDLENSLQRQ